jgi:23S rRNA G2445 N2-methylase RlmL
VTLFKVLNGLEEIASGELSEKLHTKRQTLLPYGSRGWVRCDIEENSLADVKRLRSIVEAHIVLREEEYGESFSIDHFADMTVKAIPACVPNARRISVSAYSVRGRSSQRQIQGAFSRRIVHDLKAESSFKDYDTALRITLLKNVAVATINLEIQPGNLSKRVTTHPTPLHPSIAYCMVRLCSPQAGERLLDPMCGCGTIPLMAALEWKDLKIVGADIEPKYVACARKNSEILELQKTTEFFVSDVVELTGKGIKADIIAVNPPYDITLPSVKKVDRLYGILFEEAFTMLSDRGRMAIVTPYPEIVVQKATRKFKISSAYGIHEGALDRTIHLLRKAE